MIRQFPIVLLALFISACGLNFDEPASRPESTTATVTGTVSYRERIALTPGTVVEVWLLDVSLADAPAKLIAGQTITPEHQVPIAFELTYDPADIDARLSYTVRATIRYGAKTMFITDRNYPVLTRGHPDHVDLELVRSIN
jgi:putative lipoprotein